MKQKQQNARKNKKILPKQEAKEEITALGRLLRYLGTSAGRAVGGAVGGPAGAITGGGFGNSAGAFVSKILGQGAYSIKQNTLLATGDAGVPAMHSADESIRFRRREYIGDVSSAVNLAQTRFPINPGMANTFPYLSQIAANFEQYEFKGLIFEFRSMSADALNSTNTALGTMILAARYDSNNLAAWANKQQVENEMWSVSDKPANSIMFPVECDPKENPFAVHYVRYSDAVTGDRNLYDMGSFYVCAAGSQAAAVVGELWVSYDVVLKKPRAVGGLALDALTCYRLGTTISSGYLSGSGAVTTIEDNIGLTFSSTTITYPVGCQGVYFINMTWTGASSAVTLPTLGLTNANFEPGGDQAPNDGVSSTKLNMTRVFKITDPTQATVLTFGSGSIPTSITQNLLLTGQVNGNI
jgi:hypothetical protein